MVLDKTVGISFQEKKSKHLFNQSAVFREAAVLPVSQYYYETMEAQHRTTTHQKSSTGWEGANVCACR